MDAFMSVYDALKPTARRLSRDFNLDADDLLQDLALYMLEKPHLLEQSPANPLSYYRGVLRVIALRKSSPTLVSLDVPLTEDSESTLVDILPAAPQTPEDYTTVDACTQVLYSALRKLPLEEQMYLRSVHNLNAYNPVPVPGRKPNYYRSNASMSSGAYRKLRKDQAFKAAMKEVYA